MELGECYVCTDACDTLSPCKCKNLFLHENCYAMLLLYENKKCGVCLEDYPLVDIKPITTIVQEEEEDLTKRAIVKEKINESIILEIIKEQNKYNSDIINKIMYISDNRDSDYIKNIKSKLCYFLYFFGGVMTTYIIQKFI